MMTVALRNKILLAAAYAFVLALVVANCRNSFFWDTVQLASAHADYYYSTRFSGLLLPTGIDSGHIPAFGMYIALIWEIFGRSLIASHLAMLPFAIGIVWQLFRLCRKFIDVKYAGVAALMVLADPSLLSQMTLVSPDVCLVFFFLLAVNAVLENKKWLISISILLLFLTSMRGMMVSLCVLLLDIYCNVSFKSNKWEALLKLVKRSLLYLPALLVFMAFNTVHYLEKGWIGYHKDSPWAQCFVAVDGFRGFLFNIGIYGWRIVDFGRVGVWLVFFILVLRYRKNMLAAANTRLLGLFLLCIVIILPINMLWAKNLTAHRYLIPIYLVFAIFCASILFSGYVPTRLKVALSTIWMVFLLSGHCWIYPPKTSQGWDSTLAHLPYYGLRHEAIAYLDSNHIDFNHVQSFFPNVASMDKIDLNHDQRHFNNFDRTSDYVFFSNVFNAPDADQDFIHQHFTAVKKFEDNGVFIVIYKRR
jgi:hypothetical protein